MARDSIETFSVRDQRISIVTKQVDETITSDTTISNDSELFFEVNANRAYMFFGWIMMTGDNTADIDLTYVVPSGSATPVFSMSAGDTSIPDHADGGAEFRISMSTQDLMIHTWGAFQTGATPGQFNFQWAQGVSDANDTTIKKGACIMLIDLGAFVL